MGRPLRYIGFALLVAAVWMVFGESAGWVASSVAKTWTKPCFLGGVVLLGSGLLLGFLGPLVHRLRGGRCVRCGHPTQRGQAYCWDHLQETVNEYRDRSHNRNPDPRHRRA
jgi:hypothetical protein